MTNHLTILVFNFYTARNVLVFILVFSGDSTDILEGAHSVSSAPDLIVQQLKKNCTVKFPLELYRHLSIRKDPNGLSSSFLPLHICITFPIPHSPIEG